jgi:hypothetical protein
MGLDCGKEDLPLIEENYVTFTENGHFYSTPSKHRLSDKENEPTAPLSHLLVERQRRNQVFSPMTKEIDK